MANQLSRLWPHIRDATWPMLDPFEDGYLERIQARANNVPDRMMLRDDDLRAWEAALEAERIEEKEWRAQLNTKLMAMVPVSGTIVAVIVAMTGLLLNGNFGNYQGWSLVSVLLPAVYVELQLIRVFTAAVGGLQLRQYTVFLAEGPRPGESSSDARYRRAVEKHRGNVENAELTNDKASQWRLCVHALGNAGRGLLVGASIVSLIAVLRASAQ